MYMYMYTYMYIYIENVVWYFTVKFTTVHYHNIRGKLTKAVAYARTLHLRQ